MASKQPYYLDTLHFYSLPTIPYMFLYPIFDKNYESVNPTPPAAEDITIFISALVLYLFSTPCLILKG